MLGRYNSSINVLQMKSLSHTERPDLVVRRPFVIGIGGGMC